MHPVGIGPFIVAASFVEAAERHSNAGGSFVVVVVATVGPVHLLDVAGCIVNGVSVDAFRPMERHAASIGGKTRFSSCK